MKENTLYARIVMILLAINVAFTGYVIHRLNNVTQEQLDSVTGNGVTKTPREESSQENTSTETPPTDTQPQTVDEVTPKE